MTVKEKSFVRDKDITIDFNNFHYMACPNKVVEFTLGGQDLTIKFRETFLLIKQLRLTRDNSMGISNSVNFGEIDGVKARVYYMHKRSSWALMISYKKDSIIAVPIAKWEKVNNNNYKRVFIYAFLYTPKGGK